MDISDGRELQHPSGLQARNGEMEFCRFVMACMIVLFHAGVAPLGSIGVEFFLLLTGFLTAMSMERRQTMGVGSAASNHDLWKFVLHKIKGFYVELILVCGFALFTYAFLHFQFSAAFCSRLADFFVNNILLMRMTGITPTFDLSLMDTTWYLSSMLLALIVLYPLFHRYGYHAYILVGSLLALGSIVEHGTHPFGGWSWSGFMYNANIRAISEIAIGAFLYPLSRLLSVWSPHRVSVAMIATGAKWLSFAVVVIYAFKHTFSIAVVILSLCMLIALSFSNVCCDTRFFHGKLSLYLGKISLPLFLCHLPCMVLVKRIASGSPIFIPLVFAASLAVSAIILYVSTRLREAWLGRRHA